jgi:perosamine synthetase
MPHPTKDTCPTTRRREFLKTSGVAAVGWQLAGAAASGANRNANETLAINGGSKAVTYPSRKIRDATRWPRFGKEEEKAVLGVLGNPSYGPIDALEKDWGEAFGAPYNKSHCNGTSALTSMFFALNLPPGSEIMVPSYTFFATIMPMRLFGLVPVFVDINPRTLNFDLDDAKRRMTKNTKALLPVHWFGLPCDMDHICDFAEEKGLIVLEDSAQAYGATLKDKYVGNWGKMAIFSFQMSKSICAIEGGMGSYHEREYYERATTFGHYSVPNRFEDNSPYAKYYGTGLGVKFRMHPMAATLARLQLGGLSERTATVHAQVRRLNDRITQLPGLYEQTVRPDVQRDYYSGNMLLIDEAEAGVSRKVVVDALKAEGVRAAAYVYRLQHQCAVYTDAQWWHHLPTIPELPGTDEVNRTAIHLPLFRAEAPELVDQYIAAFEKVWAHRKELSA